MVLVTLGGCHLLDGLVVVSVEARKKLVRCSEEELCEGHCARPVGTYLTFGVGSCSARYAGLAGDAN